MTLADLRKLAVKKTARVRFVLPNGMEAQVDEHGVLRIPALQKPPDFNVETELSDVQEFLVEYRGELDKKGMPRRESLPAAGMEALTKAAGAGPGDAHEEE